VDHAEHARGSLGAPFFRVVEPENEADGYRELKNALD